MPPKKKRIHHAVIIGIILIAIGALAASYFLPYWKITLYAPQYPDSLSVQIFLDHLEGDVREIDGLNHYIGMRPLGEAAVVERSLAHWAIIGICAFLLIYSFIPCARFSWLLIAPAVGFPIGFAADSFYWLYEFGNNLDETAPINIDPFTPPLFGEGEVGQFRTEAFPQVGFYLAVAAALLAIAAVWWARTRMCTDDNTSPAEETA